jgi:Zn-dependent M28 family amino/carboxypeptidase
VKPPILCLVALPLLAGCLSDGDGADDGQEAAHDPVAFARLLDSTIPPIEWDVAEQVDWWEHISTQYPKHDTNMPTNHQLREFIMDEMAALGFEIELRTYPGELEGQDVSALPGTEIHAVIATKPGTTSPDHRIGLVSHYDSATTGGPGQLGTIQGAYDDMSGVAAEFSICKALAEVPMNRTLACIFFDAEERGLVASREYVEDVVIEGDEGYVYDFVLGYDMTGINWPGTIEWPGISQWKLYAMAGQLWTYPNGTSGEPEVDLSPLYGFSQALLHGALGYPEEGVEVLEDSIRNSDERRFKEAGVPILRFAGGRTAAEYPMYHQPGDLVEYVYLFTGGRPSFEAGFAAVVEASYHTTLALDQTSLAELQRYYGGVA